MYVIHKTISSLFPQQAIHSTRTQALSASQIYAARVMDTA